jgi:hypothetical protein
MNPEKREFSGNVRLRIPASLHRDLVRKAEAEGVSLNQLACAALAAAVGWSVGSASSEENSLAVPSSSPGDEAFKKFWNDILS